MDLPGRLEDLAEVLRSSMVMDTMPKIELSNIR